MLLCSAHSLLCGSYVSRGKPQSYISMHWHCYYQYHACMKIMLVLFLSIPTDSSGSSPECLDVDVDRESFDPNWLRVPHGRGREMSGRLPLSLGNRGSVSIACIMLYHNQAIIKESFF